MEWRGRWKKLASEQTDANQCWTIFQYCDILFSNIISVLYRENFSFNINFIVFMYTCYRIVNSLDMSSTVVLIFFKFI